MVVELCVTRVPGGTGLLYNHLMLLHSDIQWNIGRESYNNMLGRLYIYIYICSVLMLLQVYHQDKTKTERESELLVRLTIEADKTG